MSINKRLISTGAGAVTCTTDSTDPFGDGYGVALYNLDYDASDASGSYDGTPSNVDFGVEGQINYGARFNGSSSNISFPAILSSAYTGSVSASVWFKTTENSTDIKTIINSSNTFSGTSPKGFALFTESGVLRFVKWNISGTSASNGTTNIIDGDWHNAIIVLDNPNGTLKLYLDGETTTPEISFSITANQTYNKIFADTWYLAQQGAISTRYFNGDIDQVRIFSKALNSTEVGTLYAETACVYTATTTDNNYPTTNLAYYKLDNSAEDEKGSYDGVETDIEYRFGRYGQAAVFNGSSSRINTGYQIPSGLSGFSVSAWVKAASVKTQYIVGDLGTGGASGDGMFQINISSSNVLRAAVGGTGSQTIATISNYIGTWTHIVVTTDSSGNIIGYVNGSQVGTATGNALSSNTRDFIIGMFGDTSHSTTFDGSIDQVRIFSSALTSSQVTELYNEKPEVDTSNFKAVLYEGNSGTNFISNVGMDLETSGGLVWLKGRDSGREHRLFDSVRGATKGICSNLPIQEFIESGLDSFEKSGFFLGSGGGVNANNESFVGWIFKGGADAVAGTGSGVTNVSVSANIDAGFSIVKFTGTTASGGTVEHGLNSEPEIYFLKVVDNNIDSWMVCGNSTIFSSPTTNFLRLNTTASIGSTTANTVGSNGDDINVGVRNYNGQDTIAYCWHSVAGYSKIGTYEGDGTNDYSKEITGLGFDPSFVMVKNVDSSGSNWEIIDSRRGDEKNLYANENYSENANSVSSYGSGKFITDGFEVARGSVSSSVHWNKSGDTYLYMAFK